MPLPSAFRQINYQRVSTTHRQTNAQPAQQFYPPEYNTHVATAIYGAAVVSDVMSAFDPDDRTDTPRALRLSALVLIACLASPAICNQAIFVQRGVFGIAMISVAFAGSDQASVGVRWVESILITLALVGIVLCCHSITKGDATGLTGSKTVSKDAPAWIRRETACHAAVATLLYASLRILRRGFGHAAAVQEYEPVGHTTDALIEQLFATFETAHASVLSALTAAFGGAVGVALAIFVLMDDDYRALGTGALTTPLFVASYAMSTAAFVSTLAYSDQFVALPTIHGFNATALQLCKQQGVAAGQCDTLSWWEHARRFALVNSSGASMWLSALGTLVLAYAPSTRMHSRTDVAMLAFSPTIALAAALACTASITALVEYLAFTGDHAWTDVASILATLAPFVSMYTSHTAGNVLFIIAVGGDQLMLAYDNGASNLYGHLTHVINSVLLVYLIVHTILTVVLWAIAQFTIRDSLEWIEQAIGIIVVSGTSSAVALYTATSALQVTYNGLLVRDNQFRSPDNRYARTAAAMIMEHWLPLFVWLPMYVVGWEVEQLTVTTRRVVWFASTILSVAVWWVAMMVNESSVEDAYGWSVDAIFAWGVLSIGIVPWALFAWAI